MTTLRATRKGKQRCASNVHVQTGACQRTGARQSWDKLTTLCDSQKHITCLDIHCNECLKHFNSSLDQNQRNERDEDLLFVCLLPLLCPSLPSSATHDHSHGDKSTTHKEAKEEESKSGIREEVGERERVEIRGILLNRVSSKVFSSNSEVECVWNSCGSSVCVLHVPLLVLAVTVLFSDVNVNVVYEVVSSYSDCEFVEPQTSSLSPENAKREWLWSVKQT